MLNFSASTDRGRIATIPAIIQSVVGPKIFSELDFKIWEKRGILFDAMLTASRKSKQPAVSTKCKRHQLESWYAYRVDPLITPTGDLSVADFLKQYGRGKTGPRALWWEPPKEAQNNASLLAIFWKQHDDIPTTDVYSCNITATWLPAFITELLFADGTSSGISADYSVRGTFVNNLWTDDSDSWPRPLVSIEKDWAENLTAANETTSLLSKVDWIDKFRVESQLEDLISILIVIAMSNTIPATSFHILDYNESGVSSDAVITSTIMISTMGYTPETFPVIMALVILGVYCVYALSHAVYTVVVGESSNSWDSVSEIATLALNSKCPPSLDHTSAGIETTRTLQQPINILASCEDQVEIVFTHDYMIPGIYSRIFPYSRIEKNRAY